eukprot:11544841-Heterocapsa_arctica.AAC.1
MVEESGTGEFHLNGSRVLRESPMSEDNGLPSYSGQREPPGMARCGELRQRTTRSSRARAGENYSK